MEENENLGEEKQPKEEPVETKPAEAPENRAEQSSASPRKPQVFEEQPEPERVEAKPEPKQRPKVELPKINMPHLRFPKMSEIPGKIKSKLREYWRVLKITKKPDSKEYKAIVKASGIGITIIGVVGFIIHMIVQLIMLLK